MDGYPSDCYDNWSTCGANKRFFFGKPSILISSALTEFINQDIHGFTIEFNISAPKFIHTISLGEKAKQLKSF